jgi:hypothetical protein
MATSSLKREDANPQAIAEFSSAYPRIGKDLVLAKELITASNLDKLPPSTISNLPSFIPDLTEYIAKSLAEARTIPGAHDDETLKRMANHICTIDSLHKTVTALLGTLKIMRDDNQPDEMIREGARGYYMAIARTLAHGYDKAVVEEGRLERNAQGKVIRITDPRTSDVCKRALERGDFLGGKKKRRQTKKKNLKKRKTLRRVRH